MSEDRDFIVETMEVVRARRKTARKILWQWGNTVSKIQRLREERAAFMEMANSVCDTLGSPSMDGMPHGGRKRDLSDVVVRVQEDRERYIQQVQHIDREIDDAIRLRNVIDEYVSELDAFSEKIITYRYVDNRSWQFIAMKLNCAERTARRIDDRVCNRVAEHIILEGHDS